MYPRLKRSLHDSVCILVVRACAEFAVSNCRTAVPFVLRGPVIILFPVPLPVVSKLSCKSRFGKHCPKLSVSCKFLLPLLMHVPQTRRLIFSSPGQSVRVFPLSAQTFLYRPRCRRCRRCDGNRGGELGDLPTVSKLFQMHRLQLFPAVSSSFGGGDGGGGTTVNIF